MSWPTSPSPASSVPRRCSEPTSVSLDDRPHSVATVLRDDQERPDQSSGYGRQRERGQRLPPACLLGERLERTGGGGEERVHPSPMGQCDQWQHLERPRGRGLLLDTSGKPIGIWEDGSAATHVAVGSRPLPKTRGDWGGGRSVACGGVRRGAEAVDLSFELGPHRPVSALRQRAPHVEVVVEAL